MPHLTSNPYDFCILGAGIAGLSLADTLHEKGYKVIVLEKNDIASGASGSPGALVNPAAGRRGKKNWKAEDCYQTIHNNLQKVTAFSPELFYWNTGVLRPALSKEIAAKMHEQFETTNWPHGWCHWQSEQQIKARHPGISCIDGGLWLPVGLTVDSAAYLQAYSGYLQFKGVKIITGFSCEVRHYADHWKLRGDDIKINSNHLIYATGLDTVDHPWWFHLPLEAVKGQVAKFRTEDVLTFNHSISSLGYIARTNNPRQFIQGSTYEHDFTHLSPDTTGEQYLRKRLAHTLPKLVENVKLIDQWSGVRVATPDRKPVIGRHPQIDNLHIFTALGSKGLLYGKFLAQRYADHLANGVAVFPEISVDRFA